MGCVYWLRKMNDSRRVELVKNAQSDATAMEWVYWQALEYVQLAQPVVLHRLENCHGEK